MKLPTPRKLPSGSWFVRVMVDGKSVGITRPTEKECLAAASALKAGFMEEKKSGLTVNKAIDQYIENRQNVLSPSTIRGYRTIQRTRFQTMMCKKLDTVTQDQWQRAVNAEAKLCSAKTLQNAWRFLSGVISEQTGKRMNIRLPQVVQNDLPFLTSEEIPAFLEAAKGDKYEIAILLGLSGLRRSEILSVRWEDIDLERGCIYVRGSAVLDENGVLVQKKENKNQSSRRTVPFLMPQLREAIGTAEKTGEYVVTCRPSAIQKAVTRICKRAGVTMITPHGLRRSFASLCYHLGVPEQIAMKAGGWSDIYTMRKIYTKISELDIQKQGEKITEFFSNL